MRNEMLSIQSCLNFGCRSPHIKKVLQNTCTVLRKMATSSNHLERTLQLHNRRNETVSAATVMDITDESSTVKSLILKIHNKNFNFKAGQWVDTCIPGVEIVGGFSVCSTPLILQQKNILQLAVKCSSHPPADWIHNKCKVGDTVELISGGDFFIDPSPGPVPDKMMFIAGGIGINPLYSMLQHVIDMTENTPGGRLPIMTLLYSAKTYQDLVFKKHLDEIHKKYKDVTMKYFITAQQRNKSNSNGNIEYCRINFEKIQKAVDEMKTKSSDNLQVFVCGPLTLIDSAVEHLTKCSITKENIHFEKWW